MRCAKRHTGETEEKKKCLCLTDCEGLGFNHMVRIYHYVVKVYDVVGDAGLSAILFTLTATHNER